MRYICMKHLDVVSKIKFCDLLDGHRCPICKADGMRGANNRKWKGGISSLYSLFRGQTREWRSNLLKECNFRCDISGMKAEEVHHLISFQKILDDFLINKNVLKDSNLKDFDAKLLRNLASEFKDYHNRMARGICLTRGLHIRFHSTYGYIGNTAEQYKKFKKEAKEIGY